MKLPLVALSALLSLLNGDGAFAWSKPGHMITAAIAYRELATQEPKIVEQIVALMAQHPDRGAFAVAAGGATGAERDQRILLQMARWPDDARGGQHDHPTWHYSSRSLIDPAMPASQRPAEAVRGSAAEAFALNYSVAADPRASNAERAVALCWLFHLVGDIHQPLHSSDWVSARFPDGDRGGNLQFVRDPASREAVNLHWFWDERVAGSDDPTQTLRRADELLRRLPRSQFKSPPLAAAEEFAAWGKESYQVATQVAYGPELLASDSAATAQEQKPAYISAATDAAERRMVQAGYRIADLLRRIFSAARKS